MYVEVVVKRKKKKKKKKKINENAYLFKEGDILCTRIKNFISSPEISSRGEDGFSNQKYANVVQKEKMILPELCRQEEDEILKLHALTPS